MTEEPLFAHEEPLVQFRAKDVVTELIRSGVPHSTASARVQNYAKQRLIYVRGRTGEGKNSPNLYGVSDAAAALMLSSLQDLGVADQEVLQLSSASLYTWYYGQTPRSSHPILAALSDTLEGHEWALQLRFMRHTQKQTRYILRSFGRYQDEALWAGEENTPTPEWEPVGDISIHTGSLHRLKRHFATPRDAN